MAKFKWHEQKKSTAPQDDESMVYDEPEDTPEDEAQADDPFNTLPMDDPNRINLRKLKGRFAGQWAKWDANDEEQDIGDKAERKTAGEFQRRRRHKKQKIHRGQRIAIMAVVTFLLLGSAVCVVATRIFSDDTSAVLTAMGVPESIITSVITPIQTLFSGVTESITGYFRTLKLRANLESEYEALRQENEELVYKAMLAEELQQTLSQYEDLSAEIAANANMQPIVGTVIGKSDGNYFSTFTINKGLDDGVEDYMAVTLGGALVGYTESVEANKSTVRTIIDSDASIAALISSSRDQGTVRGTLGIDGQALCRMYYLPDDNLPRPGDTVVTSGVGMSFPKGIPIGTVRESTRGMEDNKQYIVIEPTADFQHLEYVIVLRYKPQAEAITGRSDGEITYEDTPTARPSPIVPEVASSLFDSQATADPNATATVAPTPSPTPTPKPTPKPTATITPDVQNYTYVVVDFSGNPTATPAPTPAPTSTPYYTPDPDLMTYEEE